LLHQQQGSDKGDEKPSASVPEQAPPLPLEQKPEEAAQDIAKADEEPAKDDEPKEDPPATTDAKEGEAPMAVASEDKEGGEEKGRSTAAESMDDEDDRIQKEGFNCCGISLQA
jgi:hypothetical protein